MEVESVSVGPLDQPVEVRFLVKDHDDLSDLGVVLGTLKYFSADVVQFCQDRHERALNDLRARGVIK